MTTPATPDLSRDDDWVAWLRTQGERDPDLLADAGPATWSPATPS